MESKQNIGDFRGEYPWIGWPYTKPKREYSPGELKKLLKVLLGEMADRVRTISDFLFEVHGVRITPESPDEVLDLLPGLIASLAGMSTPTPEHVEDSLKGSRPQAREMLRHFFSKETIDGETKAMVFDGGLLWGEAFRHRFPQATWAMGRMPRSSIFYGEPVLTGVDQSRNQFHPRGQLSGMVMAIAQGQDPKWPLSRRNKRQATDLGFMPVFINRL